MKLLPRISDMKVRHVISSLSLQPDIKEINAISKKLKIKTEMAEWNAAGGHKASMEQLVEFHKDVVAIAQDCGFPNEGDKARFDMECGIYFVSSPLLISAETETMRNDCWAFLASVWLLQITNWRFGLSYSRMRGGVRNTFQRLWIRANLLDRGADHPERWLWLNSLTEDAFVQLTERPSIAANKNLAQAIAQVWVERSKNHRNMEALMRVASRKILARNEIQMLSLLDEGELIEEIRKIFDDVETANSKPPALAINETQS